GDERPPGELPRRSVPDRRTRTDRRSVPHRPQRPHHPKEPLLPLPRLPLRGPRPPDPGREEGVPRPRYVRAARGRPPQLRALTPAMPSPAFDRSRLRIQPLAARQHDLDLSALLALDTALPPFEHAALPVLGQRLVEARQRSAARILVMGAHVIRAGVA